MELDDALVPDKALSRNDGDPLTLQRVAVGLALDAELYELGQLALSLLDQRRVAQLERERVGGGRAVPVRAVHEEKSGRERSTSCLVLVEGKHSRRRTKRKREREGERGERDRLQYLSMYSLR